MGVAATVAERTMSATAHLTPGSLGLNRNDLSPLNTRQSPEHGVSNHRRAHGELLTDTAEQNSQERREKQPSVAHAFTLWQTPHRRVYRTAQGPAEI
jgi:hypothetical protein